MSTHHPPPDLLRLVVTAARAHDLDPALLAALVSVESSWCPWAWNPEPRYRYLWDVRAGRPFRRLTAAEEASEWPPEDFATWRGDTDQEWWGQQASWGLCQVMGAVAREHGCTEPYLPALCDPATGILYGCLHLRALRRRWSLEADYVAAYNAGRPSTDAGRAYAGKVLRLRDQLAPTLERLEGGGS